MNELFLQFGNTINPGRDLTIDETLLAFLGRLSIKQYNPLKRGRFGVKLFLLADSSTGFVFRILPYQGKTTQWRDSTLRDRFGFGGAAVLSLLEGSLNKGHRVCIDNWFMSVQLTRKPLEKKTHVLGTVRKNRKGMPKFTGKLKKGQVETYSDGDILVER